MVLVVEDVGVVDVVPGEHGVALAEVALARAGLIPADGVTVLVSITVLDKLANAGVTVLHAGTLEAVLVSLAHCVKSVDWGTVTWIGHWSVAENQAVTAIGPVFALVKVGVVVGHHVDKLGVAFFFAWSLTGNSVGGHCGNDNG